MRGFRVVAVLTAVATASTMVAAPALAAPRVDWARCAGAPTDDPVRCGAVSVPLDWTRPAAAERLDVQVARLPAADPAKRVGMLFFNPGGPGQGTVGFLTSAKVRDWYFPQAVRDHFDIVGVEPRGTGTNDPLNCPMPVDATVTRFPVNGSEARALVESNGRLGASCVRAAGDADAYALPAESRRVAKLAPTLRGHSEFWDIVAGCVGWPTPSRWQPHRWQVPASFPAPLLLSGAHDVATPRVWAVSVQRSLPGSRIVRWDGDGHAGWPMHDRDAVEAAGRYLVAGPASR